MAYIIESGSSEPVYLNVNHIFGRSTRTANTIIAQPEISRIHAVIGWDQGQWIIVDYGRNGTWLNEKKLVKDRPYVLKLDDVIHFGALRCNEYRIVSVSPPQDILVAVDSSSGVQPDIIPLDIYNLLPVGDNPELALFLAYPGAEWFLESLDEMTSMPVILAESDLISFAGKRWQLRLNRGEALTRELISCSVGLDNIEFVFHISADEEHTTLIVNIDNDSINLSARTHHYLTANLARFKYKSYEEGIHESEQGWVYTEDLAKALGLTETHINIQIHRARKQFSNATNGQVNPEEFIQRRGGKVRLGATKFKVVKAHQVEIAFNGDQMGSICSKVTHPRGNGRQ